MKKLALVLLCLILTGCTQGEMNRCLALRGKILRADSVEFVASITADYGTETCTFSMRCTGKPDGSVDYTVEEPESIQGISGTMDGQNGKIHFEDTAVAFPLLAMDLPSPVSAPMVFYTTLRQGYFIAAGKKGDEIILQADSSFQDGLHLDIHFDGQMQPAYAVIFQADTGILTLSIGEFQIHGD